MREHPGLSRQCGHHTEASQKAYPPAANAAIDPIKGLRAISETRRAVLMDEAAKFLHTFGKPCVDGPVIGRAILRKSGL